MTRISESQQPCQRRLCTRSHLATVILMLASGLPTFALGWSQSVVAQDLGNSPTTLLLSAGDPGRRIYLRSNTDGELLFGRQPTGIEAAWTIMPVARDMVRISQSIGNRWYALGIDADGLQRQGPLGPQVRFFPLGDSVQQLWRIQSLGTGGYLFENVAMPGAWLTCGQNGGLWLQPFADAPLQVWWPQQPTFAIPAPQYRNVSEQFVANPSLPPSSLRITNTHSETLVILLADRRAPDALKKLRIAPGAFETVSLDRDAGGTIIQTIEIADALGNWERQEYQIVVPPSILYDMSVYEEFLQSIAIDRTGKSPNVIEDINYQPRSVGFFLMPPGEELPDSGEMDAYGAAVEANNPGAVRKWPKKEALGNAKQPAGKDPLREILDKIQSKRGKF